MRLSYRLILFGALLMLTGCVRERASGEILVVNFRWWTMLWAIVPASFAGICFAKHPSTWINGKWRPWWKFQGWEVKEFSYTLAALVVIPIAVAHIFDRVEVTPDHFLESSASPLRGTRRVLFREVRRIEVPPDKPDGTRMQVGRRKQETPPELLVDLTDGRREFFNGWLVRAALPTILNRAREAGVHDISSGIGPLRDMSIEQHRPPQDAVAPFERARARHPGLPDREWPRPGETRSRQRVDHFERVGPLGPRE